jgi:hypothetical protein
MAKAPAPQSTSTIETSVSRWARFVTDIRTLTVVVVALVAAVFYAGVNYQTLTTQFTQKLALLDQHETLLTGDTLVKRAEFEPVAAKADSAAQELAGGDLVKTANLTKWNGEATTARVSGIAGGIDYSASMCPDGQYAVGFVAHGSTNDAIYCVGCLVSVQAICRPLVPPSGAK